MKTPQLTPYLTFNGNCRAAMTYYQQCLGGELQIQSFAGTPAAEYVAPDAQHGVLHACLTSGSLTLFASDAGPQQVTAGTMISLSLSSDSEAEIETLFARFAEGGSVLMPLEATFWSPKFGMLTDQFGISWMLNCDVPVVAQ